MLRLIEEIWNELVRRLLTVLMLVSNQSQSQETSAETLLRQRAAKIAKVIKVLLVIFLERINGCLCGFFEMFILLYELREIGLLK